MTLTAIPAFKRCRVCFFLKPSREFRRRTGHRYGLASWCKFCQNRSPRKRGHCRPETIRQQRERYRKAHPETVRAKIQRSAARARKNLTDSYIKSLFQTEVRQMGARIQGSWIPQSFIVLKRLQLQIARQFKEMNR